MLIPELSIIELFVQKYVLPAEPYKDSIVEVH
jgi:hypothetical protein